MATGSLALRLLGAEELLCRSETFRARVKAANPAQAAAKVYVGELSDVLGLVDGGTLDAVRPSAIIGVAKHGYVQVGQGSLIELLAIGAIWVIFVDKPEHPGKDSHKQSMLAFVDWTSRVMDEMSLEFGRDTLWPFSAVQLFFEPLRPDLADRQADDYWISGYVLDDTINAGGGG